MNHGRLRVLALMAADAICLAFVWTAVIIGYKAIGLGSYRLAVYLDFWPVIFVFLVCNAVAGLYHGNWMYPSSPLSPVEELRRLVGTALLTHVGVIAFLAFTYQTTQGYSRLVTGVSGVLVAVAAQSFRNWMRYVLKRLEIAQIPVLLAGSGETAARVRTILEKDRFTGFRAAAVVRDPRRILQEGKRLDIKIMIACVDERVLRAMMEDFTGWFNYIEYVPTAAAFPVFGAKAVSFGGLGGIELVNHGRMKIKRLQKWFIDKTLTLLLFLLASPLFLVLPVLIKLTSKGPVFYRAERLGRRGRKIRVWKFRSMYADADRRLQRLLDGDRNLAAEFAANFKLKNDPRITPLGKFLRRTSIDELPQLFNVLVGDMALIGPRPIVDKEVQYYGDEYQVFASVKPGITGLWQVSGRSDTDYVRRVALDVYYVLNWSPWMDIWIALRTVYSVLLMRGAR